MGSLMLFTILNQPKKDVLLQLWDKTFHTDLAEGK